MNRLPGEKVLLESDNQTLVLTTHRVRYDAIGKSGGWADRTELVSIMLEELASCAITHIRYPILLLLALVGVLLAVIVEERAIVGIAQAVFFAGVFFMSQRQELLLTAAGGTRIQVNANNMPLSALRDFVDEVERAKNERFLA